MDPDWVPSVLIHKKAIPPLKLQATASAEKKKKKKWDIARLHAIRPKKIEIEEPSNVDETDIVVDENILMVETEVAELNRLKEETECYRVELNKRNEEIYKLRH